MEGTLAAESGSDRLLKAEQVMEMYGFSKSKLYALMRLKKGKIPSVKIGGLRRFPLDELRIWKKNLNS